ncbi:NAD(P)H-dependent oxidoreductase [Alkalibacterium pelagium]|uniref:NADPH-dependent FMN reductase n=1 Tax=Alkalibacterium pelagium TaxID=426702 RepID=A0A1H7LBS5_9LACT|nr:NAD(P)H-dependent oxidoreductase [Alkalibacterium pelagium]GEN50933.1 hypothetical protein APE02nite_15980 [Alkalibacterium pelagium]SEK96220.1 NADPH-dependent FMN reductase [Alkalibacterium pelagium]
MLRIGIVVLGVEKWKECRTVAKTVLPYLKKIGKRAYGTSFELIDLEKYNQSLDGEWNLTEKGLKKFNEKDGFVFVLPTFSEGVPESYQSFFSHIHRELQHKSVMTICFGEQEEKSHTMEQLNICLLKYDLALPATDIFVPKYTFVEWETKPDIENMITDHVNDYLHWAMSTKYLRNIRKSLVM